MSLRRYLLVLALVFAGILCLGQQPRAWWQSVQQVSVGAAAGYQGPGDVVGGASTWWGFRAYSAATRGNKVANVCTVIATVDTCLDFSSDATTGNLVIVTIGGLTCGTVTCTVKTLYDQTGNTNCGGSACDLTVVTISLRLTLIPSCVNSLPCGEAINSLSFMASPNFTLAQPFTISWVANRTTNTSSFVEPIGAHVSAVAVGWSNSTNTAMTFAGSVLTGTASDNSWHAFQSIFNSTSSDINVDGTSNTGNAGTTGFSAEAIDISRSSLDGFRLTEGGIWNSAFSGTQKTNMCHNQFLYWGTSTSC